MDQEKTTRLYLIRHGQVNGYESYPIYGHTDVELTEVGVLQMEKVSERLRFVPIEAIYSSDLRRAAHGALIVARYHDVPIRHLAELREMYFGQWEGESLGRIRKNFPQELEARQNDLINYRPPGNGESIGELASRIEPCLEQILAKHKGKHIAVVAHGGVNRVILAKALGLRLSEIYRIQQDYGCLNIIDYFGQGSLVRLMNG